MLNMKQREANIEVYRILLILGICLLHGFSQGAYVYVKTNRIFSLCLTGFVFISGWYGIRFSWKKVLGLILIGWYCRYVGCIVYALLAGMSLPSLNPLNALKTTKVYWFLWAYIALMMIAPILNMAIECAKTMDKKRVLMAIVPLICLVFGWSYIRGIPQTMELLPDVAGAGGSAFLSFVGIYVLARMAKEFDVGREVKNWCLGGVIVLGIVFATFGIGHHMDSISAVVATGAAFLLIKRMQVKLPHWIERTVALIVPSVFSIYLLHTHMFGFSFLQRVDEYLVGTCNFSPWVACTTSAFAVFSLGVVLDVPRRIVLSLIFRTKA